MKTREKAKASKLGMLIFGRRSGGFIQYLSLGLSLDKLTVKKKEERLLSSTLSTNFFMHCLCFSPMWKQLLFYSEVESIALTSFLQKITDMVENDW